MKWGRFSGALLTALTMVVATNAAAFGGTPVPDGTGYPGGCTVTGSMQFKPALVNGGTTPVQIKLKLKSAKGTSCTNGSGDGLNVASLQLSGLGGASSNDCVLALPPPSVDHTTAVNMLETVKWKMAKGATPKKISNSTINAANITGARLLLGGTTVPHVDLDMEQFNGSQLNAGSFSPRPAGIDLATDQDINEISAACAGKGIKKLTFGVKPGKDDRRLGGAVLSVH